MTVLLTGASGFLGGHLARVLLERGYDVRAFVRPGSDRRVLSGLPVEMLEGDLLDKTILNKAVRGCSYLIHAGADTQVNPARSERVRRTNIDGTQNVLEAAAGANLARLVYIGTANVFGFGTKERPGDETRPYQGYQYGLDYMDSKWEATQFVLHTCQTWHLPVVLVHPTFMLGPNDPKPTSNAMVLAIRRRQLPGYPPGGKNYVHVRDVAVATVNALTQGRPGESYILGNENLNYRDAFTLIADVVGVPPPRWPIPAPVAHLAGWLSSWKSHLTGKTPLVNTAMTRVACDGHYFTAEKARHELSLPQTPIRTAIQEAYDWFRQNGYDY